MGVTSSTLKVKDGVVVTLDALGTLYKFKEPIATSYIRIARRCGMTESLSADNVQKAFKHSFKSLSQQYPNYGRGRLEGGHEQWWHRLIIDTFTRAAPGAKVSNGMVTELYDHFSTNAAYELYDDVVPFFETMHALKERNSDPDNPSFFVGVITNNDPRVHSILNSLGLRTGKFPAINQYYLDPMSWVRSCKRSVEKTRFTSPWHDTWEPKNHIDFVVDSYTANAEKPSLWVFDRAERLVWTLRASRLELLQTGAFGSVLQSGLESVKSGTYIHIGDDFHKDYIAAKAAGWTALQLVRDGEGTYTDEGATTVSNLTDAASAIHLMVNMNARN